MRPTLLALTLIGNALLAAPALAAVPADDAKPDIEVYIIEPKDGAAVSNPVRVVFGLRGMGVAPAGVNALNTGHHHLLIDTEVPRIDQPIPAGNKNIRHFGGGQTETQLILLPGSHTLQLLMGDYGHMSFMPPLLSPRITITVKP